MAIEIVDLPIKNGDFSIVMFSLPEGICNGESKVSIIEPIYRSKKRCFVVPDF